MNVNEKVKYIIENVAETKLGDDIGELSLTDDLQLSSLDILWIITDIESYFKINVDECEICNISTVKELIHCVQNKLSKKNA